MDIKITLRSNFSFWMISFIFIFLMHSKSLHHDIFTHKKGTLYRVLFSSCCFSAVIISVLCLILIHFLPDSYLQNGFLHLVGHIIYQIFFNYLSSLQNNSFRHSPSQTIYGTLVFNSSHFATASALG